MWDLVGNPEDWFSHNETPNTSSFNIRNFKTVVAQSDLNPTW